MQRADLLVRTLDARKDWRQEEKGMTEDEMVGWHHWLNGHEFEQTPRVGDGQGSLACCSPWGHKESDTAEHLNWRDPPNTVSEIPLLSSLCISLLPCIYLWSCECVCVCVCVCIWYRLHKGEASLFCSLSPDPGTTEHTQWKCILGFPGGAVVKNPPANAGHVVSIHNLERSHMLHSD